MALHQGKNIKILPRSRLSNEQTSKTDHQEFLYRRQIHNNGRETG